MNMKKIVLALLAILLSTITIAQDQKINSNKSNAEIFSSKSGTLIEKTFQDIGKYNKIKLQVEKFTDMISGTSIKALRIEELGGFNTAIRNASLDVDEVDGLIKSIRIINNEVLDVIPKNYTEVTFYSRSGLKAGCFLYRNKWNIYIQLNKHDLQSTIRLKRSGILQLLELLENAKSQLNQ